MNMHKIPDKQIKLGNFDAGDALSKYNLKTEKEAKLDTELIKCTDKKKLPPSSLKKIQNVSFPRSGHALLRRCLQLYFKDKFYFCEFYGGCHESPCTNPQTNYQKNHDFGLRLENNPSFNYIIQYRHPLESLVSLYKLYFNIGVIKEDTKESWIKFCKTNILYWKKFIKKWVIENKNSHAIIIPFNDLLSNTEEILKQTIAYMDPGDEINEKRIKDVIKELNISRRTSIEDFKYYDIKFFKEIEESVKDELKKINLKMIFDSKEKDGLNNGD